MYRDRHSKFYSIVFFFSFILFVSLAIQVNAQTTIRGSVYDAENKDPLIGANIIKDFFAGIRDIVGGRSGSYEKVLREAKDTALKEMTENALSLGAEAVIAVDLDYETVGPNGGMLMVTASGTAVKL